MNMQTHWSMQQGHLFKVNSPKVTFSLGTQALASVCSGLSSITASVTEPNGSIEKPDCMFVFLNLCFKHTSKSFWVTWLKKMLWLLSQRVIAPHSAVTGECNSLSLSSSNRVFTEGTCKLLKLVISDLVDEDFVINRRQQAASALLFGMVALLTKPGQTFAPLIGTWLLCVYTGRTRKAPHWPLYQCSGDHQCLSLFRLWYFRQAARQGLPGVCAWRCHWCRDSASASRLLLHSGVCAYHLCPSPARCLVSLHASRPQAAGHQDPEAGLPAGPSHWCQGHLNWK